MLQNAMPSRPITYLQSDGETFLVIFQCAFILPQTSIGLAHVAIRHAFSCPITYLQSDGEVFLVIFQCAFILAQTIIGIAHVAIRPAFPCPVPCMFAAQLFDQQILQRLLRTVEGSFRLFWLGVAAALFLADLLVLRPMLELTRAAAIANSIATVA